MSLFINPSDKGPNVPNIAGKARQEGPSASEGTAAKVDSIVSLPQVKSSRQVQILDSANVLAAKIQSSWDSREPAEIAEDIVALERRVSLLEGTSPEIERVRAVAKDLHFQFVFPLVMELLGDETKGAGPYSFARAIDTIAAAVLNTQDVSLLKQLNATQFAEIIRYATKGGA
jgi:hypothetical protein